MRLKPLLLSQKTLKWSKPLSGQARRCFDFSPSCFSPHPKSGAGFAACLLKVFSSGPHQLNRDPPGRRNSQAAAILMKISLSLNPTDLVLILDPMIATAGSALLAIDHLIKKGASQMALVGIIGSKEGLEKIKNEASRSHSDRCCSRSRTQ